MVIVKLGVVKFSLLFVLLVHVGVSLYEKGLVLEWGFSSESFVSLSIFVAWIMCIFFSVDIKKVRKNV